MKRIDMRVKIALHRGKVSNVLPSQDEEKCNSSNIRLVKKLAPLVTQTATRCLRIPLSFDPVPFHSPTSDWSTIKRNVSAGLRPHGGAWGGKVLRRDATVACHLPFRVNGPGATTEGVCESETLLEGLSDPKDAPTVTSIRQPKVEFAQVAHRILFVLPPSPLPIHA